MCKSGRPNGRAWVILKRGTSLMGVELSISGQGRKVWSRARGDHKRLASDNRFSHPRTDLQPYTAYQMLAGFYHSPEIETPNKEDEMKVIQVTFAIAIGLACVGAAHAQDWKPIGQFGYYGAGKTYELDKGHTFWVGEFSGTFLSDKGKDGLFDHAGVKCPASIDNDMNNKRAKGPAIVSSWTLPETKLTVHGNVRVMRNLCRHV